MSRAVVDAISVEREEGDCGRLFGVGCQKEAERWVGRGRGWQYVLCKLDVSNYLDICIITCNSYFNREPARVAS
jgi:hypothetical protein